MLIRKRISEQKEKSCNEDDFLNWEIKFEKG